MIELNEPNRLRIVLSMAHAQVRINSPNTDMTPIFHFVSRINDDLIILIKLSWGYSDRACHDASSDVDLSSGTCTRTNSFSRILCIDFSLHLSI